MARAACASLVSPQIRRDASLVTNNLRGVQGRDRGGIKR
jgi:hypothetical protein